MYGKKWGQGNLCESNGVAQGPVIHRQDNPAKEAAVRRLMCGPALASPASCFSTHNTSVPTLQLVSFSRARLRAGLFGLD